MRTLVMVVALLQLAGCAKHESAPSAGSGSAPVPAPAPPAAPPDSATGSGSGSGSATGSAAADDTAALAQIVVDEVGSKALGNQTIAASCVSVAIVPAGDWVVAAARLKDCGNKTARSIVWLFKRPRNGTWSEDYAGQPPKCWQNVPADIAEAVAIATKIPPC